MQKLRHDDDLDKAVVVRLAGTFDSIDADELRIKMEALESGDPAIADLAELTTMETTDVDVLIRVNQKRLRSGRSRMQIVNVNPAIGRLLHLRGLARAFDIQ
ncbi:MAG TPA: STAS domain-containing protein [Candidatus Baltobacteraceae bacterium]